MANMPELTAYSRKLIINRATRASGECWKNSIQMFIEEIGAGCKGNGLIAIGHIKGFLSFLDEKDYGYFSYTDDKQGANFQGSIAGIHMSGTFDFNVLVYGISSDEIGSIVDSCVKSLETKFQCGCKKIKKSKLNIKREETK